MMTHPNEHYQDELAGGSKSKGSKSSRFQDESNTLEMKILMPQEDTACFLQSSSFHWLHRNWI